MGDKRIDYHIGENMSFTPSLPDKTGLGKDMSYLDDRVQSWRNTPTMDIASAAPFLLGEALDIVRAGSAFADGEIAEGGSYLASAVLPINLSLGVGALKAGENFGEYSGSFLNRRIFENTSNTIDGFYGKDQTRRIKGIASAIGMSAADYLAQRINPFTSALSKTSGLNRGNYRRLTEYLTEYRKLEATGTRVGKTIKVSPEINVKMRTLAKQMHGEILSVYATAEKFGKELPDEIKNISESLMKKLPDGEVPASYFGKMDGLNEPIFYQMSKGRTNDHAQAIMREQSIQDLIHYAKYNADEKALQKVLPTAKRNADGTYEMTLSPKGKPDYFIGGFSAKVIVDPRLKEKQVRMLINDEYDFGSGLIRDMTNAGGRNLFSVGEISYNNKYLAAPLISGTRFGDVTEKVAKAKSSRKLEKEIDELIASHGENTTRTFKHRKKAEQTSSLLELYEIQKNSMRASDIPLEFAASATMLGYRVPFALSRERSDASSTNKEFPNNKDIQLPPANGGLLFRLLNKE